jgi:hypothetical protein
VDKEKQNIKVVLLNPALDKSANVDGIITEHKIKCYTVTYKVLQKKCKFIEKYTMSLINSAINQIGREIGRDIYHGRFTNNRSYSKSSSITDNESILNEIKEFKLAGYDKVSVRQLANLIELTNKIEPNSFDWEEPYTEIDSKIDFAKEHLDKEHLESLESLDKKNSLNHKIIKEKHLTFVKQLIFNYQSAVDEYKNKNGILIFILSLIGLGQLNIKKNYGLIIWHIILIAAGVFCVNYGYQMFEYPTLHNGNLPIKTPTQIKLVQNIGLSILIFGGVLYLIMLLGTLSKFLKLKKNYVFNKSYLEKLIEYQKALK